MQECRGVDWNDLRYLLALKRAGSLAGAARELKVDGSTVSRRLAALEEALGAHLLRRTPDGLTFTEAGEAAAATAAKLEASTAELERTLSGEDERPEGTVRLTFPDGFMPYLISAVGRLREPYPKLQVELIASPRPLDLSRGEADVALRLTRPSQEGLLAKRLGTIGWALYASEKYLLARGTPKHLGDFEGHDVVHYEDTLKGVPGAVWLDAHARAAKVVMRANSPRTVMTAALEGLGICALPCFTVVATPELRRLTPDVIGAPEVFAVTAPDRSHTRRVRLVVEMLVELFDREAALFAGR